MRLIRDEEEYYGWFKNNLPNGKGHLIFNIKNHEYIGEFQDGKFHGNGVFKYGKFGTFRGNFVAGIRQGAGEWVDSKGVHYEGLYKNDMPNGIGYLNDGKGFRRKVEFIDGKINKNYKKL